MVTYWQSLWAVDLRGSFVAKYHCDSSIAFVAEEILVVFKGVVLVSG